MMTASLPSVETDSARPLCPACGAHSLRILTSVEVQVDVVVDALADELQVIDEALGDAAWDEDTPVACPACDWHGTVGELHERALTELPPA
ncbi:MAG: hypothetical protein P8Y02_14640 [Deinococcales bacterium]